MFESGDLKAQLSFGSSGKLGRVCLADLLAHGYAVTNVDLVRPADDPSPFVRQAAVSYTAIISI